MLENTKKKASGKNPIQMKKSGENKDLQEKNIIFFFLFQTGNIHK